MEKDDFVFQGIVYEKYYVFEPEYLAYEEAPPPIAYLFTKKEIAKALDVPEDKIDPFAFLNQVSLPLDKIVKVKRISDYLQYCSIEDELLGLEHQKDPEIREIALYYIKKQTTFLDIQYEGCFRGYEIYVPRMSDGGMEAITMLLTIHPHHENIFSLKGQAMDVILHELNFTSMRYSILKHPAIAPLSDIQWIATFNSKDVLRIVNKDGSPEAVPRYIYCTYSANWRLVRGDEIHELVNFLPSVEQQNEPISLQKKLAFKLLVI